MSQTLSAWLKQEPTEQELNGVFTAIAHEENDRAAALSASAMVEVGLTNSLRARLWIKNDKADDDLFEFNGPLGTFSAKIRMAHAMRIIGPATRDNLNRIRTIRNAFAHTPRNITFDLPQVSAVATSITFAVWPHRPRLPHIASPRHHFLYATLGLFVVLEQLAKHTRSGESVPWDNYPINYWWGERYPAPLP